MLGAMSSRGMLAMMTVEAATDTDIFLAYLDHVLCPKLRPGDVVVMDNLSTHKVDGVRQRIQQCGAELLYLPPYSPDLNPIEKAWVKRQATAPFGQGPHPRIAGTSHHRSAAPDHRRQRRRMVQTPPRPYTEIGEML